MPRESFEQYARDIAALMAPDDLPRAVAILRAMHRARTHVVWARNLAATRGRRQEFARLAGEAMRVAALRRALRGAYVPVGGHRHRAPGAPNPTASRDALPVLANPDIRRRAARDDDPPPSCSTCGRPANTIHAVPHVGRRFQRVELACRQHDPGSYWLEIDDYAGHRDRLLAKRDMDATVGAMDAALGWSA